MNKNKCTYKWCRIVCHPCNKELKVLRLQQQTSKMAKEKKRRKETEIYRGHDERMSKALGERRLIEEIRNSGTYNLKRNGVMARVKGKKYDFQYLFVFNNSYLFEQLHDFI